MTAARFRPEITASDQWLLANGVSITCCKVTPFSKDDDLFLTVDHIIPPLEGSDDMIRLAGKSAGEKARSAAQSARHVRHRQY